MASKKRIRTEAQDLPSVLDVAAYILADRGEMPAIKLQKLCYYSQAWSLVWDDRPLFNEPIQAWTNGPVIPALYSAHRGQYSVSTISGGDPSALNDDQCDTINAVMKYYGDKSSQWLSNLTHMEDPWRDARRGVAPGEPSSNEITLEAMAEYYSSLSAH